MTAERRKEGAEVAESEGAKEGRKELPTNVRKLRPSNANAW